MLKCIHKLYTAFAMLANMTHWMNKCMQADPAIPVNSTNHTSTFPHFSTNHTSPSHSFQPITHTHHTYFNQSYSHFSQYSTKHTTALPQPPSKQANKPSQFSSTQIIYVYVSFEQRSCSYAYISWPSRKRGMLHRLAIVKRINGI